MVAQVKARENITLDSRDVLSRRYDIKSLLDRLTALAGSATDVIVDRRMLGVEAAKDGLRLVPRDKQAEEFLPREGSPITYRALPQLLQKLPRLRIGVREFRSLLARYPKEAAQLLNDTMCCDDTIPDEWRDTYTPHLGSTTFRDNLSKDEDDLSPEWLLRLVNYGAGVEEFNEPQVVRAFLSNKYARLDNITAASFVAQQVMERQLRLLDCSLSETSMRMTITDPDTVEQVIGNLDGNDHQFIQIGKGSNGNRRGLAEMHQALIGDDDGNGGMGALTTRITNSDTGGSALSIQQGFTQMYCINTAMVWKLSSIRHTGRSQDDFGLMSQQTMRLEDEATKSKITDYIDASLDPEAWRDRMQAIERGKTDEIKAPSMAVQSLVEQEALPAGMRDKVLEYFLGDYGGMKNRFGLAQAVSRASQDVENVDLASDLEEVAGKLMVDAGALTDGRDEVVEAAVAV